MNLVGNSHLVAGGEESRDAVLALISSEGYSIDNNPDLYLRTYAHFGVEDARDVRDRAQLSAVGDRRIFVLTAAVMTNEAQNALLKTLEDAPGDALFILVVPNPNALLSTLRSRSQILGIDTDSVSPIDPTAFLASSPAARLEMLKPLLEKNDDDKRDIAGIVAFLSALERRIADAHAKHMHAGLESIYRARRYMGDKGSLTKPLLEQVALLVPLMKA